MQHYYYNIALSRKVLVSLDIHPPYFKTLRPGRKMASVVPTHLPSKNGFFALF